MTAAEPLMDSAEAAGFLSVKESWLRDHPEVPRVKLGRLVRYRASDLNAWIDRQRVAPSSGRSARSKRKR